MDELTRMENVHSKEKIMVWDETQTSQKKDRTCAEYPLKGTELRK
jgi:hypothetical protein